MDHLLPMKRPPAEPEPTIPGPVRGDSDPLMDFFNVLFRHKTKIALTFIVAVLAALVVALRTPRTYTSEAKLLVRRGRESMALDPTTMGQFVPVWKDWNNELNSEFEILKSRELLENVVEQVGMTRLLQEQADSSFTGRLLGLIGMSQKAPYPSIGRAVCLLSDGLQMEVVRKSDIIRLRYTATNPEMTQQVLPALIQAYLDKHIDVYRSAGAYEFLTQQAALCRSALEKTESELRALKDGIGISSLESKRNINVSRANMLRDQKERMDARLAASGAKVSALRSILERASRSIGKKSLTLRGVDYADIESALLSEQINLTSQQTEARSVDSQILQAGKSSVNLSRLNSLEMRREELTVAIATSLAKAQTLQSLIAKAAADKNKELRFVNHEDIQSALWTEEATLASQKAEIKVLTTQLSEANSEITKLNAYETRIQWLKRGSAELDRKYRKYSDNLEQARIDRALESEKISNIKIVQAATVPLGRNTSPRPFILSCGVLAGLFGGVLLAFACESLDRTFKKPEDVQRELHLPVLGTIPRMSSKHILAKFSTKHPNSSQHRSHSLRDLSSEARRHFDLLAYRLLSSMQLSPSGPTVLGLTSSGDREGVSSLAANLAVTMARHTRDNGGVLLVDGNSGSAASHHNVELKGEATVWEIKADHRGDVSVLEQSLYTFCDGKESQSDSGAGMPHDQVMQLIRQRPCAVALVDMPPITQGLSSLRLASTLDYVVLVIESEKVRFKEALKSQQSLAETGSDLLGVIFNKERFHIPNWLRSRL